MVSPFRISPFRAIFTICGSIGRLPLPFKMEAILDSGRWTITPVADRGSNILCTRAECSYTSDTKPTTPRGAMTAIFGATPSALPLLIVNVSVQAPLSRVTTDAANKAN